MRRYDRADEQRDAPPDERRDATLGAAAEEPAPRSRQAVKRRWIRRLAVAAVVLAVILAPLAWLVGTRGGLELVWRQVASRLGSGIEVEELDGRLLGPLRIRGLALDAGSLHIEVRQLDLDWRPARLLRGTFFVERLALSGVDVTQKPEPEAEPAPPSPSGGLPDSIGLPVDVVVREASIEGLRYFASAEAAPVPVDRIALAAQLEKQSWRLENIEVASPRFATTGEASLVPSGEYAIDLALDWTLRWPDYPEAHGATRLSGDLERLTLRQTVDAPYGLDAQVSLTKPLSDGLLDGRLEASFRPAALGLDVPLETIDANAALGGTLAAVDVTANAALAAGEQGSAAIELDATYSGDAIDVRNLEIAEIAASTGARDGQRPARSGEPARDEERTAGRLALAGNVALDPATTVELAGGWQNLAWPLAGPPTFVSPKGSLRLSGTPGDLAADLSAEVGPSGSISGTVRRSGEQLDANLEWREVDWPLTAATTGTTPDARSGAGKLTVAGTLDEYRFTLDADLAIGAEAAGSATTASTASSASTARTPASSASSVRTASRAAATSATAGHVLASGTGSLERLDFEQIDADVLGGKLFGTASAVWKPSVAATAALTAEGLDPGLIDEALEGRLDGRIDASGALEDGSPSARVTTFTLDGSLRGRRVHFDAAGRYAEDTLELERLTASSGKSGLHAEGSIGAAANLTFGIESPDLADFWPDFAGKLEASGTVRGPRATPVVAIAAEGSTIRLPQAAVGRLTLDADVDVSGKDRSTLELALEDARVSGTEVASLEIKGDGDARAHSLSLAANTSVGTADIALGGSVEGAWTPDFMWRFDLERATLAYPALAPWGLEREIKGRLSAGSVELDRGCWRSGEARLCVDVTEQDALRAGLALTALPFGYFAPLLPESVSVAGDLTATADLSLPEGGAPLIDVTLHTTPGHIAKVDEDEETGPAQGLAFGAGEGHIVSDGTQASIDFLWPFESQGQLDLHAVLERRPGGPMTASTIAGDAAIEVRDLSFVPDVVREVDNTAGKITGDVELSGTLAAPRLEGRIALEGGRADLVAPGITVENLELAVVGDGSGQLEVEAKAESGGGRLAANGSLRLDGATPIGDLQLSGEAFELYSTSDATVFVSPDLRLSASAGQLRLDGKVVVPSASITPQVLGTGAITASPDQVIVNANGETEERSFTRPLYAKVQLGLGDVSFTGYGLTARLGGGLEITETPGEPTTATGEVRIEQGTYEAYGQMLNIRRGRLTFAGGPITRPGLDIEAVRQATEDILVGARVRGTLAEPELSLFSEPSLPQQEQLSYLVLGRPLDNASSSESSALQNAAIALGLKGGNVVSERLNRNLGFQEFGIETKPGEGATSASFVIGRYLSPSLYVSYGVGLFEPVNTLTLRYAISSRWRLVTESSSQSKSGDLIYHIERGE